jgi:hypothetical protein
MAKRKSKPDRRSGLSIAYQISKQELQRLQKMASKGPLTKEQVELLAHHSKICQQYADFVQKKSREDLKKLSTMTDDELEALVREELAQKG